MTEILESRREKREIIYNEVVNLRIEEIMKIIINSCVKNCRLENKEKVYRDKSQFIRSAVIYYLENFVKNRYPKGIENVPLVNKEENSTLEIGSEL